jgi:integrase
VTIDFRPKRAHYQKLDGGRLRKQVTDPLTGRRVSISADNPLELAARVGRVAQIRRDLRSGIRTPAEVRRATSSAIYGELTVLDIWRDWIEPKEQTGPTWVGGMQSVWNNRFAELAPLRHFELTEGRMVKWWAAQLAHGIAPITAKNAFDALCAAFRLAVRSGKLDALPWGPWRPRAPRRREREACRSFGELRALLQACTRRDELSWSQGRFADLAYRAAAIFYLGLRQGEAAGLGWDRLQIDEPPLFAVVDWQACRLWRRRHPEWLRPMDPPKSRRTRTLDLSSTMSAVEALRAAREQLRARGWYRPDGPVFPGAHGEWREGAQSIAPAILRACVRDAGLPNPERWVTHSLRHSFATLELVAHEGDTKSVQQRTGHSSAAMLVHYLHAAGRGLTPSRLPALEAGDIRTPAAVVTLDPVDAAQVAMISDVESAARAAAIVHRHARQSKAAELARRRAEKAARRPATPFGELARQAVAAGIDRPVELARLCDEAYSRAYQAAARKFPGDPDKARAAGRRARRAKLAAWARCLTIAKTEVKPCDTSI